MNFLKPNTWLASLGLVLGVALQAQTNLTVGPVTYTSGQNLTFTATNTITTNGAVVVSSGANITYQAGLRVELKPGFQAVTGSTFSASIPDTDGDGMSDFFEVTYGLNPFVNDAAENPDDDGFNNLAEYLNGTPPNDSNNSAPPGVFYYGNPQFFGFTGTTQSFVVPPGVVSIKAKVWGAGGGAGSDSGVSRPRILGGAGGYSEMEWGVVPGTVLTILVGEGGQVARMTATFGGGGSGYSLGVVASGSGGGYSEVTAPNGARLLAGGGGGAGTNVVASAPSGQGGNGGGANLNGLVGSNNTDSTAFGGGGGTTTAGGSGGAPNSSSGSGASLLGQGTPAFGGAQYYGGGGGGGYFGGGAGSSWGGSSAQAAGGGGGSGYARAGLNVVGYQHNNAADSYWGGLAGVGGKNGPGGHGRVVLLLGYSAALATPQITSASAVALTVGSAGTYQITATNSPTSYEIAGDPPPGMSVNAGLGQVTGTPTQIGNYRLLLKAANNAGISTRELTISVSSAATDYLMSIMPFSASGNFVTPANLYDKATLKVWGAGGGSLFFMTGSVRDLRAKGGQGGYGQMDVSLNSGGGQTFTVTVGAGGVGRASVFRGAGGARSRITIGSADLIAGGGGGAGGYQYYSSGNGYGGDGGNGGGANLAGNAGVTMPDNYGYVAGGGTGGSTSIGLGGAGHVPWGYSGAGQNAIGSAGGWGGSYYVGNNSDRMGGEGGSGYFGGGGGGVIDRLWPAYPGNTSFWWKDLVGAGGGGGSGYAAGGTNIVGYNHNNSGDSDYGNQAGEVGQFSNNLDGFDGRSGRAVIRLLTTRPAITSGAVWSIVKGISASYSVTTGLVATSFQIQSGNLPAGMRLDARTGVISGTATETGSFLVSVVAANDAGMHQPLALTITVALASAPQQYLPYVTGFEPYEGYSDAASSSLSNQAGWTVLQGYAEVFNGPAPKGQNAVRLLPGTPAKIRRAFLPAQPAPTIVFADCVVKLTADPAISSSSRLEAGPSLVALVKSGAQGELMVFQAAGSGQGTWVATGKKYALDGSNQMSAWARLTIRQDYVAKKWDLYADGKIVAAGVGLDTAETTFTQFTLQGHATGLTYVDQVGIMPDNPLFTDADRDGMDDNWERANGLNPTLNDRTLDFDNDGLNNLQEFRYGSAANVTDTDGDGFSDSQEVAMGTNPTIPATADPGPPGIILHEPVGATLVP